MANPLTEEERNALFKTWGISTTKRTPEALAKEVFDRGNNLIILDSNHPTGDALEVIADAMPAIKAAKGSVYLESPVTENKLTRALLAQLANPATQRQTYEALIKNGTLQSKGLADILLQAAKQGVDVKYHDHSYQVMNERINASLPSDMQTKDLAKADLAFNALIHAALNTSISIRNEDSPETDRDKDMNLQFKLIKTQASLAIENNVDDFIKKYRAAEKQDPSLVDPNNPLSDDDLRNTHEITTKQFDLFKEKLLSDLNPGIKDKSKYVFKMNDGELKDVFIAANQAMAERLLTTQKLDGVNAQFAAKDAHGKPIAALVGAAHIHFAPALAEATKRPSTAILSFDSRDGIPDGLRDSNTGRILSSYEKYFGDQVYDAGTQTIIDIPSGSEARRAFFDQYVPTLPKKLPQEVTETPTPLPGRNEKDYETAPPQAKPAAKKRADIEPDRHPQFAALVKPEDHPTLPAEHAGANGDTAALAAAAARALQAKPEQRAIT